MTKMTPEQMRELADKNDAEAEEWRGFSKTSGRIALHEESAATLRAAADQLDAVRAAVDEVGDMLDGRGRYLSEVLREMLGMER